MERTVGIIGIAAIGFSITAVAIGQDTRPSTCWRVDKYLYVTTGTRTPPCSNGVIVCEDGDRCEEGGYVLCGDTTVRQRNCWRYDAQVGNSGDCEKVGDPTSGPFTQPAPDNGVILAFDSPTASCGGGGEQ